MSKVLRFFKQFRSIFVGEDILKEKDEHDTTLSAEERQIGGLGILLVKKNMDNIEYKYENNKNILILSKNVNV